MVWKEILPQKIENQQPQAAIGEEKNFDKREKNLKNKIHQDENKYTTFSDIFQNISKQKIFSDEDISTFIEDTNINFLYRKIENNTKEEQNKIVLEKIDIFLGKTIKTNETREEQKNIDNKVISTTTENISTTTEKITEKTEKEKILESRKATQAAYDTLDDKDKITDNQLQLAKTKIPQEVIDAVNKKTAGTELKSDDFFKFYLLGENKDNANKPEYQDFMKNYKQLKKTLEIPEFMSFKEASEPKNTDRIIEDNKYLKEFTETSPRLDTIKKPILPQYQEFDQEFELYVKFIPNEKLRKNIESNKKIIKEYQEIYQRDPEDARNEKAKNTYDEYTKAKNEVKKNLQETTQQIVKQRTLWSCITGLAKYFDTSKVHEDISDDFNTNTQDGYQIQKGKTMNEQHDDILYINGNIKGNTIGFYYNLNNPDAQLQSDDFLHFDTLTETFGLGKNNENTAISGGKNNLGVKLPTLNTLSTQAQHISENIFTTYIEKATNQEDFVTSFKNEISNSLLKNYGQETLIKTRIERDIEKNITIQTLNTMFIPPSVRTAINANNNIDKTTETKARKFLKIRDKTTENMRSDELKDLRWLMIRLDPLMTKEHHKNLEPRREKLLKEIQEERQTKTYTDQRWSKILKFFNKFSKNNQIDLQNIEIFIKSIEKEESIGENIHKFSPDFQTREEKKDADRLLENIA